MPNSPELLFYDGHCGLCHRAAKFVLRHDHAGDKFLFAPLHGTTFEANVPAESRATLPNSVVVLTAGGRLLVRSDAFIHICRRIGRIWRAVGACLSIVPRPLRDAVYNLVGRTRYRIFGRRDDVCPIVPVGVRGRFLP